MVWAFFAARKCLSPNMCSLQRPLDTKTQIRVAVEAEAILNVIALWEAGQFELVSSQALMFEAEQITPSPRKAYILEALSKADLFLQPNKQIEERAQVFVNSGIVKFQYKYGQI